MKYEIRANSITQKISTQGVSIRKKDEVNGSHQKDGWSH